MILKCSECGRTMKHMSGLEGTSHGICQACLPNVLSDMGIGLEDFIQSYPTPVALFDSRGHIVGTNEKFRDLFPTNHEAEERLLNIEVFDKSDTTEAQRLSTDTVSIRKLLDHTQETGTDRLGAAISDGISPRATHRRRPIKQIHSQKMGDFVAIELED